MMLEGKVAIITGAVGGIGLDAVRIFVEQGAKVLVADLNQDAADNVAAQYGDKASGCAVNVSDYASVKAMVDTAVQRFGTLTTIVNNAGISIPTPLMDDGIGENFQKHVAVNQVGVMNGMTAAARAFIELGVPGVIINTSSIYAEMAAEMTFSYNVSKAAVTMMTKCGALELAPHKIRVVGVAPGRVDTPMLHQAKALGVWDQMQREQMRNEFTQPEEIANVMAFLASDASNAINGSVVAAEDGYLSYKFPLVPK